MIGGPNFGSKRTVDFFFVAIYFSRRRPRVSQSVITGCCWRGKYSSYRHTILSIYDCFSPIQASGLIGGRGGRSGPPDPPLRKDSSSKGSKTQVLKFHASGISAMLSIEAFSLGNELVHVQAVPVSSIDSPVVTPRHDNVKQEKTSSNL